MFAFPLLELLSPPVFHVIWMWFPELQLWAQGAAGWGSPPYAEDGRAGRTGTLLTLSPQDNQPHRCQCVRTSLRNENIFLLYSTRVVSVLCSRKFMNAGTNHRLQGLILKWIHGGWRFLYDQSLCFNDYQSDWRRWAWLFLRFCHTLKILKYLRGVGYTFFSLSSAVLGMRPRTLHIWY